MKFVKILSLILITSVSLISCSEDSVNPENNPQDNFTYPFSINSFWYYGTRNFVTNLRPDSLKSYFTTDTISGFGGATFLKDTIIKNDTLRLFRNSHSDEGHAHTTLELYKQTDSGLIRHAFYSDGTNFGPFRHEKKYTFSINGIEFQSTRELINFYNNEYNINYDYPAGDTVLFFDNPPVTTVKYPVIKGTEWNFYSVLSIRLTKKYIDYETIVSNDKSYYCIKIQKQWYSNNSLVPDSHLIFYDYFSKDGMVKRDFTIKDVAVSNSSGQLIGYIDVKEEAFLNIFSQP